MKHKIINLEPNEELGTSVPSYDPEFGTRLATLIDRVGGVRKASKFTGASEDSLANWRDGKTRPSFFGMQGLCQAAGTSLDWLATGEGEMLNKDASSGPLDESALSAAIFTVEEKLQKDRKVMEAEDKCELISIVYNAIVREKMQKHTN